MCLISPKPCKHKEKICYKIMRTKPFGLISLWGPYDVKYRYKVGWIHQSKPIPDDRMTIPYTYGFHAYARLGDALEDSINRTNVIVDSSIVVVRVRLFDIHTKGYSFLPPMRYVNCYVADKQQILKIYQPKELEKYRRK